MVRSTEAPATRPAELLVDTIRTSAQLCREERVWTLRPCSVVVLKTTFLSGLGFHLVFHLAR